MTAISTLFISVDRLKNMKNKRRILRKMNDKPSAALSDAALAARRKYKREYMRKWRTANPDKVAKNERNYWERKAAQMTEAKNDD